MGKVEGSRVEYIKLNEDVLIINEKNELIGVNNKKIESIVIPNNVKSIKTRAFYGCTKLKSIVIPGNVKKIGKEAFMYCYCLRELTVEEGVEHICTRSFQECDGMRIVSLPKSLTQIGYEVFYRDFNLHYLNYYGTPHNSLSAYYYPTHPFDKSASKGLISYGLIKGEKVGLVMEKEVREQMLEVIKRDKNLKKYMLFSLKK